MCVRTSVTVDSYSFVLQPLGQPRQPRMQAHVFAQFGPLLCSSKIVQQPNDSVGRDQPTIPSPRGQITRMATTAVTRCHLLWTCSPIRAKCHFLGRACSKFGVHSESFYCYGRGLVARRRCSRCVRSFFIFLRLL